MHTHSFIVYYPQLVQCKASSVLLQKIKKLTYRADVIEIIILIVRRFYLVSQTVGLTKGTHNMQFRFILHIKYIFRRCLEYITPFPRIMFIISSLGILLYITIVHIKYYSGDLILSIAFPYGLY